LVTHSRRIVVIKMKLKSGGHEQRKI